METIVSNQVRYITNEQGERVGVLLDWALYSRITHQSMTDPELLISLEHSALLALAESILAPAALQTRLNELLTRNSDDQLSAEENAELDGLLEQVDQLTILKTRARYTLNQFEKAVVMTYISVELQRQLRAHFANACAYCHTAEALTVVTFEFEHIIPRVAGGQTTFENLCFACPAQPI